MTRQGIRPARQTRSRATRDRMVAALETLLRSRRLEAITVAEIAQEAGVSVGSVYRRFENREAFIPVAFDLYRARLETFFSQPENRYTPDPAEGLRTTLRELAALGWRFLAAETHLVRTAHIQARLRPDLVGDDWQALLDRALGNSRTLITLFASEIRVKDHDAAARMVTYLMNTALIERALYPDDGVARLVRSSDEEFCNAMADAVFGYLTA
ncbi:MAG: TetR/AcrR family transcriptional regulator [Glycocaulis sp.]